VIDVIKSKEVLKEYLDIIININNDIVVHDLVVHLYYLIKLIKCNYFILEKYNVFLTLINNIENFNQKTIVCFFFFFFFFFLKKKIIIKLFKNGIKKIIIINLLYNIFFY